MAEMCQNFEKIYRRDNVLDKFGAREPSVPGGGVPNQRIAKNGGGKQGCGNRPPIDDRNPIRKFSIDCLDVSKTND